MDKLFLLSFSLLYLLGGEFRKVVGILLWGTECAVCKVYKKNACLDGENTCTTTATQGCRTRFYYVYSKETGEEIKTNTPCGPDLVSSAHGLSGSSLSYVCCGEPNCNKNINQKM
uniref:UPAR/Ly6 domain-containing protein n=1 Tax=Monodelphis domestica TaxID=13616 RepID=A0A5F8GIQ4_MONDO